MEIPDKGKDFVQKWAKKIKPLIMKENGKLYHFTNRADHFDESFSWDAKPRREATGLEEVCIIPTLHNYGYYGFFKPSVDEVLNQIPEHMLDEVEYFHVQGPQDANDLNAQRIHLNEGFHLAQTTFYRRRRNSKSVGHSFPRGWSSASEFKVPYGPKHYEMCEWCRNHCTGRYAISTLPRTYIWLWEFESPEDAEKFKPMLTEMSKCDNS